MAYIMCKWCYGTGFATLTDKCQWCYGTGCDRQATEKAGMAPPTGFSYSQNGLVPKYITEPYGTPKPQLPTYRAGELDKMPDNHFTDLAMRVKKEMERRTAQKREITPEDRAGFHNFLTGVAHAMACRFALRWLKGHDPIGKTPQSGEMWNAIEGSELQRRANTGEAAMVRTKMATSAMAITSNPLTWHNGDLAYWLGTRRQLLTTAGRFNF